MGISPILQDLPSSIAFFGRPRGRNRNSSPSCLAVAFCHDSEPNGRPRTTVACTVSRSFFVKAQFIRVPQSLRESRGIGQGHKIRNLHRQCRRRKSDPGHFHDPVRERHSPRRLACCSWHANENLPRKRHFWTINWPYPLVFAQGYRHITRGNGTSIDCR